MELDLIPFAERGRALRLAERVGAKLPPAESRLVTSLLAGSPDPDGALLGLDSYLSEIGDPRRVPRHHWHALLAVFAHSRYLTNALCRHPDRLSWSLNGDRLHRVLSWQEMRVDLGWIAGDGDDREAAEVLARFKRIHLLRIALRDLLGHTTLAEATLELSNLADAVLQGAYEFIHQDLVRQFGRPLSDGVDAQIESEFVVLGLGKLGGAELNYSSDIDLIYFYLAGGTTSGPLRISNKEFYSELCKRLTSVLSSDTPNGFSYRVDLRLRPEGSMGEVCAPLTSAIEYYHRRARDWERQMLIKARPVAGSRRLGRMFLSSVEPLIYQTTTDFSTIEKVAQTRDRIHQNLRRKPARGLNIKLAKGAIRDIEFLVQCMQRLYGGGDAWVRSPGTLVGLHRLRDKGYLSRPDYATLHGAYHYFRGIEHRLQIFENRQTHQIPEDGPALLRLARMMHGRHAEGDESAAFLTEVNDLRERVAAVYERVIYAQAEPAVVSLEADGDDAEPVAHSGQQLSHSALSQLRYVRQIHTALAARLDRVARTADRGHVEALLDRLGTDRPLLDALATSPAVMDAVGEILQYSPYLSDKLVRFPRDLEALALEIASGKPLSVIDGLSEPREDGFRQFAALDAIVRAEQPGEEKVARLRGWFRHQSIVALTASLQRSRPIYETLSDESLLADCVIRAAYSIAWREIPELANRPSEEGRLHVVALGRLGMQAFDLGSDADLVFVLDDVAADEKALWVRFANRLIEILSAYTSEGVLFSVDTRLRPMGRDGELVQTESTFLRYFREKAEAWEAVAYMKARALAGDSLRATAFLERLQDASWRHFGEDAQLPELLRQMRDRLEQEQGAERPLKAGVGGFYDIDFALLYRRLRSARVFFESLNTPERIDICEAVRDITPEQAETLRRNALYLRSLDHAMRVANGHSAKQIPSSRDQLARLSELVGRWSRIKPAPQELLATTKDVLTSTRRVYHEVLTTEPAGAA